MVFVCTAIDVAFYHDSIQPRNFQFGAAKIVVLWFPQRRRKCTDVRPPTSDHPPGGDSGRRLQVGRGFAWFGIPAGLILHQKNSLSGGATHSFQQCHPRQAITDNNRRRAASHQQQAISDKPSATSHQQPTTSNQPPATSNNCQPPARVVGGSGGSP